MALSRSHSGPLCLPAHLAGFVGSLLDSLLGATCQVTRFDDSRGLVVKAGGRVICGRDLLSNTQVNLISILVVSLASAWAGPLFFCP
jgi:uncharacterized membrane protein